VTENSPERSAVLEKLKLEVQQRDLASFDAPVTEYDLPVRSGFMKPDRSLGVVMVRYMSPTADAAFDDLSRALMASP